MTKTYVKDSNGKYRLVEMEKDQNRDQKVETKLSLEELDARLKRVEGIVIGPRK